MKIKFLIDNFGPEEFLTEWGLAIYIEYNDKKYLLDAGGSEKFILNAQKMGIDIEDIDYAILSHAHYDHSTGFDGFLNLNKKAQLYASSAVDTNCYVKYGFFKKYIGIPEGLLEKYRLRIEYVGDIIEINPGVFIMRHKQKDYTKIGKKSHMVLKEKHGYKYDNFNHEQNLIFRTTKGLVVLSPCSHIGADNIIDEVNDAFPNENVYMFIGGLHLSFFNNKEVKRNALRIKERNVEKIYTGHCTGEKAYKELKEVFEDKISQTCVGLEINIENA